MKAFFTTLLAIICVAVLILGNIHWNKRTSVQAGDEIEERDNEPTTNIEEKETKTEEDIAKILELAGNWPEDTKVAFQAALSEGQPFHILFVGSKAIEAGSNPWPQQLQLLMEEAYGESVFTFETITTDLISDEYVAQELYKQWNSEADLIVFEPFTLNDNGEVVIEQSHANILTMIAEIDATVILQPPHPLYNTKFYPIQVSSLEKFATDNGIPYLNHWTAWPDPTTVEIQSYLDEEGSLPNDKGQEVWANFLADYFINN
ncbi:hypothetical protein [Bacillus coreaensis]